MEPRSIEVQVNPQKEIREIAQDFQQPIEVLREALANAYDAIATEMRVIARAEKDETGRRILTVDFADNGWGMTEQTLIGFFGLGFSQKPPGAAQIRPPIGYKGHGTKIYYLARELWVATRVKDGSLLLAHVARARERIMQTELPQPKLLEGAEAERQAAAIRLPIPDMQGTTIRLIDFTADSARLIDGFRRNQMVNYLRWFSVYGSFEHVLTKTEPKPPFKLLIQGTDDTTLAPVGYGHPWPADDRVELRQLRAEDERRPFNYFRKTFRSKGRVVSGGHTIDIAILFEGKRGRLDRDHDIRRQKAGGLYLEEERYGLWLAKDYIPIELRAEWMQDERLAIFADLEPKRALVFVNCQDFALTANRGSVGNSQPDLLRAVHDGVIGYLQELEDDADLQRFWEEYEEERLARARDKDQKALKRRIDRYNKRSLCTITLSGGETFEFQEPTREITLYGLIVQLQLVDPDLLGLHILDYDDHQGIDLLVLRGKDPTDLLAKDKDKVAYTEIKYVLHPEINHAFQTLHAIICWQSSVLDGGTVTDVTGESFALQESKTNGTTHTVLTPRPDSRYKHQVRVIVLKRLLEEKRHLQMRSNPRRIKQR